MMNCKPGQVAQGVGKPRAGRQPKNSIHSPTEDAEGREELEEEIARCEAEIAATNWNSQFQEDRNHRVAALIHDHRTRLKEMMKDWEQIELTSERRIRKNPKILRLHVLRV